MDSTGIMAEAQMEEKKKASIFIIVAGGTLGMKKDAEGILRPEKGYLHNQLVYGHPHASPPKLHLQIPPPAGYEK